MKKAYMISVLILFFILSCSDDPEPSLYDPNWTPPGEPPQISTLSPDSAFAGIGVITIEGQNFSPNPHQNFVYFNKSQGTVLDASETMLQVKSPNLIGDSINIKIAVHGAELFSNTREYKLYPAVETIYEFNYERKDFIEQPQQIACDRDGNLYYTFLKENSEEEFDYEGLYYLPKGGEPQRIGDIRIYSSIKMGPNDEIYALYGSRKSLYNYPAGGGDADRWSPSGLGSDRTDFDFDSDLNVWLVGTDDDEINRVTQDKDLKSFPFEGAAYAVTVYDNALYIAAARDSLVKIYKKDIISADSLSAETEYVDMSSFGTMLEVTGMKFSADGYLYISANTDAALHVVEPGGGSFSPLYPELFDSDKQTLSLVWGPYEGTNMYICRRGVYEVSADDIVGELVKTATILRVDTQRQGAPSYGRGEM